MIESLKRSSGRQTTLSFDKGAVVVRKPVAAGKENDAPIASPLLNNILAITGTSNPFNASNMNRTFIEIVADDVIVVSVGTFGLSSHTAIGRRTFASDFVTKSI